MTEIISRAEAKAKGLKRYFTGKPCKCGHIDERFVTTWTCVVCCLGASRGWIKSNPHERAAANRRWQIANAEKVRAHSRRYYYAKDMRSKAALVDAGLLSATASGTLLDEQTALDLFKCEHNAFEFLSEGDSAPR